MTDQAVSEAEDIARPSGGERTEESEPGVSARYLLGHVALLEAAVRAAVAARRGEAGAEDPFRGLYLTDDDIDRLLDAGPGPRPARDAAVEAARARLEELADDAEADGHELRLRQVRRRARLDAADVGILLVALAPDVDGRFERLYGYLHDDVTRLRPSIGLAAELCGLDLTRPADRHRVSPVGALVEGGLVLVGDAERPFLSRTLQVPDRVTAWLLGGDHHDRPVRDVLAPVVGLDASGADTDEQDGARRLLTGAVRAGLDLVYIHERPGASGRALAATAVRRTGGTPLVVDLERLPADDPEAVIRAIEREARLDGRVLVAGPFDGLVARHPAAARLLADGDGPLVLCGRATWEPGWSRRVPVTVAADPPPVATRHALWLDGLDGRAAPGLDLRAASRFRLTPEQVTRAAAVARHAADATGGTVGDAELRAGVRAQNGASLEGRARRIEPAVTWDDLVLPTSSHDGLVELAMRFRHREQVLDGWKMRPGGNRGRGVTALFAGDSGTGKTMSAEVIAAEFGLDLYAIDLATVVDKYVGETEKHLERIFTEADSVNGVLLFDEADAVFGKRSEVRDAHDRYANTEVAYLLQRMESFDGLAILTTNLRSNLDDAFTRRIDVIVDFPLPDDEHRRLLWDKCLPPGLPRAGDLDLDFCARRFELTGGNIRSAAVTAAYLAAESGRPVTMEDLVRAIYREYRKLGRLTVESEFGPWLPALG